METPEKRARKPRKSNRTRILRYIIRTGPVSRAAIAEELGIAPAAVTTEVAALVARGLVRELGESAPESAPTPGRRRMLIDLNGDYGYSVGVEFTENLVTFCLVNLKGRRVRELSFPPGEGQMAGITGEIIENVEKLLALSGVPRALVAGVGIAVPGHMDVRQERFVTHSTYWKGFDVGKIRAALSLPVVCENNVRAMACGEYFFAPNSCPEDFAFFHIGRGMFCANMIGGELFLGNNYICGEIGHTVVNTEGPRCECGKYGCLQTYASESWLIRKCRLLVESSAQTVLRDLVEGDADPRIEDILTAYSLGDRQVVETLSEAVKYLGVTISNVAIVMNPSKIFLHSRLFNNQDLCNKILDYVDRQLLFVDNSYVENLEILPYTSDLGARGAAALAVDRFFIGGAAEGEPAL